MTKTPEDHAARFDEKAATYDDAESEEYRRCADLVVAHAAPGSDEVVLDIGTGTGEIALALAPRAKRVIGRDISTKMLDRAREKADAAGIENVAFGEGRFREPRVTESVDVVVSNFAMHHLADAEKREAIAVIAELGPRKFVLGDVMFFGAPDPDEPFFSPEVDDPATVGLLADALTDAGFSLTAVESVGSQSQRDGDGDHAERSSANRSSGHSPREETVGVGHEQVGVLVAERATAGRSTGDARSDTETATDATADHTDPDGIATETDASSEGPIVPDEGGPAHHEE